MEISSLSEIIFGISGMKGGKDSSESMTGFEGTVDELLWNLVRWSPFSYLGPGDC